MTPSNIYKRDNLADLIPVVWGEMFNNYYKNKRVASNFFIDRSSELAGGGDVLYTPNFVKMNVNTKSQQNEVTLQAVNNTKITLTVQTHKEVSFVIEDIDAARVKNSYATMSTLAENAGYEIADDLEKAILALFTSFTSSTGASTANIADSNILEAIATAETNTGVSVYDGGFAFFFHPNTFYKQIQALDKFSIASNSPVQDPVSKKPMPSLYGIPVYITANIAYASGTTGRANALVHKNAIHFATSSLGSGGSQGAMIGSGGVRVQANYIPNYLGTLVTADIIYGVVKNKDLAGVRILSA